MEKKDRQVVHPADHLANERTFLSWVRTGIAIIGLGFVVVKFALFLMQISSVLGKLNIKNSRAYSGNLGVALIVTGLGAVIYGYYQFSARERQLQNGEYAATRLSALILTLAILLIGILLPIYLVHGI